MVSRRWLPRFPARGWFLLGDAGQHRRQRPSGLVDPRPQEPPVPPGGQRLVLDVHGRDQLLQQATNLSSPVASLVVGARSASRSQRRMSSTRVARNGGHDRARCPASSAVSTGGSWVPVAVRVSSSSAVAWASQADRLRDLQSSQPAASATTRRTTRVQPRAPSPSDSAAAGVPVGAEVGVRASADLSGGGRGRVGALGRGRGSGRGRRVRGGPGLSRRFGGRLVR
jgi:hypothetical protein